MAVQQPEAPVAGQQTFGGLVKVASGQTATLFSSGGVTIKGRCVPSTEDPSALVAQVTVASDEAGTQYSSMSVFTGNVCSIGPADGDVVVLDYDAGCPDTGTGPLYVGGVPFSLAKPSGRAFNGVMSCGVGVLGTTAAVFSGYLAW